MINFPRKHHYVPAFYLNLWGQPTSTSRYKKVLSYTYYGSIFCPKERSVEYICCEEDLNSRFSQNDEEKYKIEKCFLSVFDDSASKIHKKILKSGPRNLSQEERRIYTCFLLSLKLRQPDAIKEIREFGHSFALKELNDPNFIDEYKKINAEGKYPLAPEELIRKASPGLIENFGIDSLVRLVLGSNNDKYQRIFFNLEWFVRDFSLLGPSILTCDNPHYASGGLEEKNYIFMFPLSPRKVLFCVADPAIRRKILALPSSKLVEQINLSIVHQAYRWVIALRSDAESVIRENFGKSRKTPIRLLRES